MQRKGHGAHGGHAAHGRLASAGIESSGYAAGRRRRPAARESAYGFFISPGSMIGQPPPIMPTIAPPIRIIPPPIIPLITRIP